jgi:serine/threonine protein kinase
MDMANSPTLTHMATQPGVLLGTAAYMSPEQAKAKAVDRRADIWAFGCVLYELLTGRMAFSGETVADTLAAVIRAEPDWTLLPGNAPARVQALLRRCLQKDPKQRRKPSAKPGSRSTKFFPARHPSLHRPLPQRGFGAARSRPDCQCDAFSDPNHLDAGT